MGNQNITEERDFPESSILSVHNFEFIEVLWQGRYGKIWKVRSRKSQRLFALKVMSKAKIISNKNVNSVLNEKILFCLLKHPFIIKMEAAFQDRENLYLVMDLLSGGDLRFHLEKNKKFSETETKFFSACIISALEYLHYQAVLYRDLKPENLMFDSQGYLILIGFGISTIWNPNNSSDTSGTPCYMAPEVLFRQNHCIPVDYFALGVLLYECMFGRRPYFGSSRWEIRDHVVAKQVQIKRSEIPASWSLEAADFINQLIQRNPAERLGSYDLEAIKNHPWFRGFEWNKLLKKELKSPYIPLSSSNRRAVCNQDTDQDINESNMMLRRNSIQAQFKRYFYDPKWAI
ncbi:unnamed protein product [Paramecium octaurelia]|uniref:Protein kinase domain-containing protein n=1 Tax=Paramecium octaurelia TaxID=43137 RepID=A0A8S1Y3X1_PAROT|nr:unnamed protein product [Paramecium octaurelia]CAD8206516.1 unnamed protein product [Paramecium octaurelia]